MNKTLSGSTSPKYHSAPPKFCEHKKKKPKRRRKIRKKVKPYRSYSVPVTNRDRHVFYTPKKLPKLKKKTKKISCFVKVKKEFHRSRFRDNPFGEPITDESYENILELLTEDTNVTRSFISTPDSNIYRSSDSYSDNICPSLYERKTLLEHYQELKQKIFQKKIIQKWKQS